MRMTVRLNHFALAILLLVVVLSSGFTSIHAKDSLVDVYEYLTAEGDTNTPEEVKFPPPSTYLLWGVGATSFGPTLFLQTPRTRGVFAKPFLPRGPPLKPLSMTHQ